MINRQQASQLLLSLNLRYQQFCAIFFSFRYQSVTPAPVASKTFLTFPTSISIISVEASLSLSFFLFLSLSLSFYLYIKWANPGLFFVYFWSFQTKFHFLHQINVKNVHPVYGAKIRAHDLTNMSHTP